MRTTIMLGGNDVRRGRTECRTLPRHRQEMPDQRNDRTVSAPSLISYAWKWLEMQVGHRILVAELGRLDRTALRDIGFEACQPIELMHQDARDRRVLIANGLSASTIKPNRK